MRNFSTSRTIYHIYYDFTANRTLPFSLWYHKHLKLKGTFWYVQNKSDKSPSTTTLRERPLDSQGGPGFFLKKIFWPWFWPKKIFWPWPCVKKISWLHPLKKKVCPLFMKRKCLPSIHEKKMSALSLYSTNHVYLHRPNAFGFWQMCLHLCYETLKRISNCPELA